MGTVDDMHRKHLDAEPIVDRGVREELMGIVSAVWLFSMSGYIV